MHFYCNLNKVVNPNKTNFGNFIGYNIFTTTVGLYLKWRIEKDELKILSQSKTQFSNIVQQVLISIFILQLKVLFSFYGDYKIFLNY